jgi:hypothetical protein
MEDTVGASDAELGKLTAVQTSVNPFAQPISADHAMLAYLPTSVAASLALLVLYAFHLVLTRSCHRCAPAGIDPEYSRPGVVALLEKFGETAKMAQDHYELTGALEC